MPARAQLSLAAFACLLGGASAWWRDLPPSEQRGAAPYPFPADRKYQTRNEKDGPVEGKINVHCPGAPGRLSALSVFLCESVFYCAFVWARRALNS